MSLSHTFDLTTSTSFQDLVSFWNSYCSEEPDVAATQVNDFEVGLRDRLFAVGRELMIQTFQRLDVRCPEVKVDEVPYRRRREAAIGEYDTSFGTISTPRSTFRRRGGHGGRTIAPIELRLGLVGGRWTPLAAQAAARFVGITTPREAARLLRTVGMSPSASHLDRLPKLLNDRLEGRREQLEASIRQAETKRLPLATKVRAIFVSLDGIMLAMKRMRERDRAETTKETKGSPYQEVGCAILALLDKEGERLHAVKFARMPETKKITLKAQLKAELVHFHELYPDAEVIAVADGALENWRILNEIAAETGIAIEGVLDFFHAVEHLSVAMNCYAGDNKQKAAEDIQYWRRQLRDNPKGVDRLLAALKYRMKGSEGGHLAEITREFNYFDSRKNMMRYHQLRERHLPIGSGIQEATCKTLVTQRMKWSGMSWREQGGQAILTIRSLEQSGRFQDAWPLLMAEFRVVFQQVDPSEERKAA